MRRRTRILIIGSLLALPIVLFCYGRRALQGYRGLQPGDELPQGLLESMDGQEVDTDSWCGSETLLVLFRSTCPACRSEIQNLEIVSGELPDINIVLLSVDGSPLEPDTIFPVYRDRAGTFLHQTRKLVVPALYWIDSANKVQYARIGPRPADSDIALFKSLLPANKIP